VIVIDDAAVVHRDAAAVRHHSVIVIDDAAVVHRKAVMVTLEAAKARRSPGRRPKGGEAGSSKGTGVWGAGVAARCTKLAAGHPWSRFSRIRSRSSSVIPSTSRA
jgi:hypothetical protein